MRLCHPLIVPVLFFVFLPALAGCSPSRPGLEEGISRGPNVPLENPSCEVPGNPANWLAAYCMWMNGVAEFDRDSDAEDDPVKLCIRAVDRHQAVPKALCARNKYFKEQLCETLTMNGVFQGSVANCLASRGTIPRVVREGL